MSAVRPLFEERFSQYLSLIANPARVYPNFLSIGQLGVLQLLPWMGCLSIARTVPQNFIRLPSGFPEHNILIPPVLEPTLLTQSPMH